MPHTVPPDGSVKGGVLSAGVVQPLARVPDAHPTNAVVSPRSATWLAICLRSETRRASRALARALLSEASTTEERRPMMAMTTSSSMRVKPFDEFMRRDIFCMLLILLINNFYPTRGSGGGAGEAVRELYMK